MQTAHPVKEVRHKDHIVYDSIYAKCPGRTESGLVVVGPGENEWEVTAKGGGAPLGVMKMF